MKKHIKEFCLRGLVACGIGPIVLGILYLILKYHGVVETLTVDQVCTGIFSLSILAFISGGANELYQIERLPLMFAILIHGCVLYAGYLITYLLNDWLDFGMIPILVFTTIFIVGYLVIWAVIYSIIKRSTDKINILLKEKHAELDN